MPIALADGAVNHVLLRIADENRSRPHSMPAHLLRELPACRAGFSGGRVEVCGRHSKLSLRFQQRWQFHGRGELSSQTCLQIYGPMGRSGGCSVVQLYQRCPGSYPTRCDRPRQAVERPKKVVFDPGRGWQPASISANTLASKRVRCRRDVLRYPRQTKIKLPNKARLVL